MKLSNSFIAVKKISSSVPREKFSEDELNQVAELILQAEGIINPIILRRKSLQSYEVIDGHFEYYAAAKAKEINSKKGEYVGAFILEPENEEILQQQVKLLRNREYGDNEMKQKLESLTAQFAELAKSVKELEKLKILDIQVNQLGEAIKKIENDLSDKQKPENSIEIETKRKKHEKNVLSKAQLNPKPSIAPKDPTEETEESKYSSLTLVELKDIAKKRKVKGYSKMNKEQILTALTSSEKV